MMKKYKNDDNTKFVAPSKFYANEYKKLTECEISFIPHAIDKSRIKTEKAILDMKFEDLEKFPSYTLTDIKTIITLRKIATENKKALVLFLKDE